MHFAEKRSSELYWRAIVSGDWFLNEAKMENNTLLMATAMQIASQLDPSLEYRLRLVFLGGGTKPHLFFVMGRKRCFTFNIYAARLDRLDDESISDCDPFTPIFKGDQTTQQAAEQIAVCLGWQVTRPSAETYSLGLYGLGLLLQRFALDNRPPAVENGSLQESNFPGWFSEVDDIEHCQGYRISDEMASAYWRVQGQKGSAIFDLSEACAYLVGEGKYLVELNRSDESLLLNSINRIEAWLRFRAK